MSDHVRDMSLIRENELLKQKVEWGIQRIYGMERREVTFRSEIEHRDDFIRRLLAELRKHGWNHNEKRPEVHALLQEGKIYENTFVIMQEGNVYERGSDQSGESPETTGT